MKKRKIAAFANGWSDDFLMTVLAGIREKASEDAVDVYTFIDYSCGEMDLENEGELNIHTLPKLEEFDGVIMMSNTFNFDDPRQDLARRLKTLGVPAISLEYELEGLDFIGTENTSGMMELVSHLVESHNVKDVVMICGHADNMESLERLAAVKSGLAKYGYALPEQNILYGDFSDVKARQVLGEWFDAYPDKLPDAVICANDIMALGILDFMDKKGLRVPQDIIVTGYDHIKNGIDCEPSLTTVGRDWERLGYNALNHLLQILDGKTVEHHQKMRSKLVVAQSCGCHVLQGHVEHGIGATAYGKKIASMDFDTHNRLFYRSLRDVTKIDQAHDNLTDFFSEDHTYEGNNFMLCLVKEFFETEGVEDDSRLPRVGFGEYVDVVCRFKDGTPVERSVVYNHDIVPSDLSDDDTSHVYVIAPLHSSNKCFGYMTFCDNLDVADVFILFNWTRHVNQYLEQVRINMRLEEANRKLKMLYVKDGLTGLYNRFGYSEYAIPYLQNNQKANRTSVLMIADINRMKVINDRYGHANGDLAITTVARVLEKALPGWIIVRYGGDEYLMVGECEDQEELRNARRRIHDTLKREITRSNIEFPLSISLGAVWIEPDSSLSVETHFQSADRSMYTIKKRAHAAEEEANDEE